MLKSRDSEYNTDVGSDDEKLGELGIAAADIGECLDVGFYHVQTTQGVMTVELRVDHNGYYGGWLELREFVKKERFLPS